MWPNAQETTFTEEILDGNISFFAVIQLKEFRRIHDFMYHHDNAPDASYWHTSDLKAHTKEKKGQ